MSLERALSALHQLQLRGATGVVTAMVSAQCLASGTRMSHENGVLVRCRVRIVDDARRPRHAFFTPGRTFVGRLRHGTASFTDDARLTVRSASLKLDDTRGRASFAMLMNTGEVPLFWSARTFTRFMAATIRGRGKHFGAYLRRHPQALLGGQLSVRRNPESFAGLSYHSQTCFGYLAEGGARYLVRYRLVPFEGWTRETETGVPTREDRGRPWLQNPLEGESRSRNYLKDELVARLRSGVRTRYRWQVQLRPWPDGPTPPWASSAWAWDEQTAPWLELAEVELLEPLSHEEAVRTWFEISDHPPSLPVPSARSIDDPHSLNTLRVASRWARRARLLHLALRGVPAPFSDSRKSPDWQGIPPMPSAPGP